MVLFRTLGAIYGLTVTTALEWSPAWPPNQNSHLLATAKKVYAGIYPESEASVVHAGLECGWIVSRCEGVDCISIGPTYQGGHTVEERLDTSSVKGFYDAVKGVMLSLFQEQQIRVPAIAGDAVLADA